jgi:hypothetical protein
MKKKLTLASLPLLGVLALLAAGCGGDTATNSKAADVKPAAPTCPAQPSTAPPGCLRR